MGKPAARMGDLIKQDGPHCHAPIHPDKPKGSPAMPLALITGAPTVLIGGMAAARVTDASAPCMLADCSPGGPGVVAMGSTSVLIAGMAAARMNDPSSHPACSAPIPMLTGKVLPPCCPTVLIG